VFLLFLVHCDRPFVGPVYEVILALVRNVRNGSFSDIARLRAPTRKSQKEAEEASSKSIPGKAYRAEHRRPSKAPSSSTIKYVQTVHFTCPSENSYRSGPNTTVSNGDWQRLTFVLSRPVLCGRLRFSHPVHAG
jgi:hypothetical protein